MFKKTEFQASIILLLSGMNVCFADAATPPGGGAATGAAAAPAATPSPLPSSSSSPSQSVYTSEAPGATQPTMKVPITGAYQLCSGSSWNPGKPMTIAEYQAFAQISANQCQGPATTTSIQACYVQMIFNSSAGNPTVTPPNCPTGYLELVSFGNTAYDPSSGLAMSYYDQDMEIPSSAPAMAFYQANGYGNCNISSAAPTVYSVSQQIDGEWPTSMGGQNSWVNNGNTSCRAAYCWPWKPISSILLPVGTNPSAATSLQTVSIGTQFPYLGKLVQVNTVFESDSCNDRTTGAGVDMSNCQDPGTANTIMGPPIGSVYPNAAWHVTYTYNTQAVVCTRPAGYYQNSSTINNPNNYPLPSPSTQNAFTGTTKICVQQLNMFDINNSQGQSQGESTEEEKCATTNSPAGGPGTGNSPIL